MPCYRYLDTIFNDVDVTLMSFISWQPSTHMLVTVPYPARFVFRNIYVILPAGMPLLNERKSGFFRLHYDRKLHFRKSLRDCPSLAISCRACALKKMWKRNRKPTNSGSRWPTDVSAHSELQAGAVAAVAALRSPAPRAWRHLIPGYIKNTTLTQLQGRRISEISSRHA